MGVTLKSPRLNVGSTPTTEKADSFVQKRSMSRSCWSVAKMAIGSGAHVTSCTKRLSFCDNLHCSMTVNSKSRPLPLLAPEEHPCFAFSWCLMLYTCCGCKGSSAALLALIKPPFLFIAFVMASLGDRVSRSAAKFFRTLCMIRLYGRFDLELSCGLTCTGCSAVPSNLYITSTSGFIVFVESANKMVTLMHQLSSLHNYTTHNKIYPCTLGKKE